MEYFRKSVTIDVEFADIDVNTTERQDKDAAAMRHKQHTCYFCSHFFHAFGLVCYFQNVRHRGSVETAKHNYCIGNCGTVRDGDKVSTIQ